METKYVTLIVVLVVVIAIFVGASLTGGAFWNKADINPKVQRLECELGMEWAYPSSYSTGDEYCRISYGSEYTCVAALNTIDVEFYESTNSSCSGRKQLEMLQSYNVPCSTNITPTSGDCEFRGHYAEPQYGDMDGDTWPFITCCKIVNS